jgi:hypothetical protein
MRIVIVIFGTCVAIVLGACGGDDGSGDTGTDDQAGKTNETGETFADAYATGRRDCGIVDASALANAYGTKNRAKLARRYAVEIYPGLWPKQAAMGCLKTLKTQPIEPLEGSP